MGRVLVPGGEVRGLVKLLSRLMSWPPKKTDEPDVVLVGGESEGQSTDMQALERLLITSRIGQWGPLKACTGAEHGVGVWVRNRRSFLFGRRCKQASLQLPNTAGNPTLPET